MYGHPALLATHAAATAQARHAVFLPLLPEADAPPSAPPEWVELIPAGTFTGRDGRGPYTLDAQAVLAAYAKGGVDLPIDYEHQTLEAADKTGPVPAAGWIKALEVRDGAIWGRVAWTERAASLITAREYRYLSPVFRHDKAGRVLELEAAGLTHYPNLDLQPVAHRAASSEGDSPMSDLKAVAAALGAAEDADAAELAAHASRLVAELEAARATREPDPREWVPMSRHHEVVVELERLRAEHGRVLAEARHAAHAAKVQSLVAGGSLPVGVAEDVVAALDALPDAEADRLVAAMSKLPPMVPAGEIAGGAGKTRYTRAEFEALSAHQRMAAIRAGAEITD